MSPPEKIAYVIGVYSGTGIQKPDYLATIDVDPASKTYSQVVHRLPMPNIGDELHHFGWNACASCHGERNRRYLIIPGLVSGRIHVIDTAVPGQPKLHKVIEPDEVVHKTRLTAPHTVHCLADGRIMISMLGDENLNGPGGFLLLNDKFEIAGRWEATTEGMNYNYDFWYQPRHNVMVSSEWAAPKTTRPGFALDDVKTGKYGHHLHFWDWSKRKIDTSIDLGEKGMIPLEVRFHHDPASSHGFVGAAQFYPNIAKAGSLMLQLDADTTTGGLKLNDQFLIDFGKEPNGPARAHEMRFPDGDSTSDVWI